MLFPIISQIKFPHFLFCRGSKKAQVHIVQVLMEMEFTVPVAGLVVVLIIRLDIPLRPLATLLSRLLVTFPPHHPRQLLYRLLPCTHLPQAFPWPKRESMHKTSVPLQPTIIAPSTHLDHQLMISHTVHSCVLQWWARRDCHQASGLTMCTWVPTQLLLHLLQHYLQLHPHPRPTSPQVALPSLTQPQ